MCSSAAEISQPANCQPAAAPAHFPIKNESSRKMWRCSLSCSVRWFFCRQTEYCMVVPALSWVRWASDKTGSLYLLWVHRARKHDPKHFRFILSMLLCCCWCCCGCHCFSFDRPLLVAKYFQSFHFKYSYLIRCTTVHGRFSVKVGRLIRIKNKHTNVWTKFSE